MIIFPLSTPARVVFILIAIVIGLIWSMFQWPGFWRKIYHRTPKTQPPVVIPSKEKNGKKGGGK